MSEEHILQRFAEQSVHFAVPPISVQFTPQQPVKNCMKKQVVDVPAHVGHVVDVPMTENSQERVEVVRLDTKNPVHQWTL